MKRKIGIMMYVLFTIMWISTASAQTGIGSSFLDNGYKLIQRGTSEVIYTESLFIGPKSDWTIDGDIYIYSQKIWIAPTAKIKGSGRLIIKNPGMNPYYQNWGRQESLIDGNAGAYIAVNIIIDNGSSVKLTDIKDPGFGLYGTVDNIADLKISANLDFNAAGGHVLLNGSSLYLGDKTELLNAGNSVNPGQYIRGYVVTGNNPASMLVKNMQRQKAFIFPVGSYADSYTPAIISTQDNVRLEVGVIDYAKSNLDIPDSDVGMDRVWKILADKPTRADYTLIHQLGTNGQAYVDVDAQIMQYSGGNNWIGDITEFESTGIHSRRDILVSAIRTAESMWFTKFSSSGPQAVDDNFDLTYADQYNFNENTFNILANDIERSSPIDVSSVQIIKRPMYGTVSVNPTGTVTYTPDYAFVGEDVFEYQIADQNGRTSSAKVTINVLARDLQIPNVFTPNGDGRNDFFEIIGFEHYDQVSLVVVNRWGNEVYRKIKYDNSWDGHGLNSGTYFYIIEATKGNVKRVFKGDVLIKRN